MASSTSLFSIELGMNKYGLGTLIALFSQISLAAQDESGAASSAPAGLAYRLARVLDISFLTVSTWIGVGGVVMFFAGVYMWAYSEKTNLPKQLGVVTAIVGALAGSLHGCQRMGSQEVFQTSEVESLQNAREFESSGYLESNGE